MPTQLALRFEEVPVTDSTQARYHAVAPCLAGKLSAADQAHALNLSYSTVARWLRQFRADGVPDCFPPRSIHASHIRPSAPSSCSSTSSAALRVRQIVNWRASVSHATNERLHNETIKALLSRYFFWRYTEFRDLINYPVSADPQARRLEMVKLWAQGWSEQTVATLLRSTRVTVRKWVRRFQHEQEAGLHEQLRLLDHSHQPHSASAKTRR
jgi:transposase